MTKPAAHPWSFKSKFRRNAFGWRGTRTAIDRIAEALAEIRDSGRSDPAVAGSVPVIASSPVTESVRQKWLERLYEACRTTTRRTSNPWLTTGKNSVQRHR